MGVKLLWTAVALYLIAPVVPVPEMAIVAGVLGVIGCILNWLDK